MNMPKRFFLQYFIQLLLVSFFLAIIFLTFWIFVGYSLTNFEVSSDLTTADASSIESSFSVNNGEIKIDSDMKNLTKKQDGWLAVLSKDGKLLKTYNTPAKFTFTKDDYGALFSNNDPVAYDYKVWTIREDTKKPLIIIFGTETSSKAILSSVKEAVNWEKGLLNLSDTAKETIKSSQGWIQLVGKNGSSQDGYLAEKQKSNYSLKDLLELTQKENSDSAAYYHEETGQVLLVSTEKTNHEQIANELLKTVGSTAFIIFVVILLLLLIITIWYGYKFGAPLVTIIKWIGELGNGLYEQGSNNRSILHNKKGRLKKKYRIYKELITTLTELTETLEKNKQARKKATKVRDEWISGLSHDLKTPLATIGGYAEMLRSDQYSWSEEEIRTFSGTIAEKSQYMKELLEDLTLTYQLRSNAFPIAKEKVEINEQIRRIIIHYINSPTGTQNEFMFQPFDGEINAAVDPKWFRRIMENLIENAIKYNAPATTITVATGLIDQYLLTITIEDNGVGMDTETLNRLFERYYRGTNTSSSNNGTGLGMAITKKLIELHGGSINVKSEQEQGTCIRILLPLLGD